MISEKDSFPDYLFDEEKELYKDNAYQRECLFKKCCKKYKKPGKRHCKKCPKF